MKSKREHEGYYMTDNRQTPAIADSVVLKHGLPAGAGRGLFESSTFTCHHCQKVVVNDPKRTRPRSWCKKCDHYICDGCGAQLFMTGVCRPFKKVIEEAYEAAIKGLPFVSPF